MGTDFLQAGCLSVTQHPTLYQSTEGKQRTDFRKEDRRNWSLQFVDPLPDSWRFCLYACPLQYTPFELTVVEKLAKSRFKVILPTTNVNWRYVERGSLICRLIPVIRSKRCRSMSGLWCCARADNECRECNSTSVERSIAGALWLIQMLPPAIQRWAVSACDTSRSRKNTETGTMHSLMI